MTGTRARRRQLCFGRAQRAGTLCSYIKGHTHRVVLPQQQVHTLLADLGWAESVALGGGLCVGVAAQHGGNGAESSVCGVAR